MKKIIAIMLAILICLPVFSGCSLLKLQEEASLSLAERQAESDYLLTDEEEISYVMIYNPDIYDENVRYNPTLFTGEFDEYVEAVIQRADGLEEPLPEQIPMSAAQVNAGIDLSGITIEEGSRGGAFITPYRTGDTHEFYCGSDRRVKKEFTCMYAGENCNIWTCDNSITAMEAREFAREFDNRIYDTATDLFGESRFARNGGKVNILFYDMPQRSLCGFFINADLFASDEVSANDIAQYGINTDHDIININSYQKRNPKSVYSTMAHEFQHLICFTGYFETANYVWVRTWLNEAMSGYIEEVVYPGSKDISGHYEAFTSSDRIRHGQSIYNFDTSVSQWDFDIGVYGSVYLFSEYLANKADDDVFSDIHDYWRNSYSDTLDEAEAIVNSVSSSVYHEVDEVIDYDGQIDFQDADDEWLSKLTLDFYISLLQAEAGSPDAYEKIESQTLLYDEVDPADIEGGGRVIVSLRDGEFKFPEDADEGLVYIGFDKDFNIITERVIR